MSGQDIGFFEIAATDFIEAPDLVIENGDLKADNGFETAVLISLFTDRFVAQDDLPDGEREVRGWWADNVSEPSNDLIGSPLWTLDRAKISDQLESFLEDFAKEALKWMLEDGIASTITATATRIGTDQVDLSIEITKPDGQDVPFQFIWDGQELRASEET